MKQFDWFDGLLPESIIAERWTALLRLMVPAAPLSWAALTKLHGKLSCACVSSRSIRA